MIPYYIFTGGPGSGKSTTLEALSTLGYCTVPEVGRAIIQQQIQELGDALPWLNKQRFFELMFESSLVDYQQQTDQLTFFDRGLLDSIGYAQLEQLTIHPNQYQLAKQLLYATTVFIFSPWESIYTQDKERKQNFDLAIRTYEIMRTTYEKFNYQLVTIPCTTIEKRVDFILDYLRLNP